MMFIFEFFFLIRIKQHDKVQSDSGQACLVIDSLLPYEYVLAKMVIILTHSVIMHYCTDSAMIEMTVKLN